MNRIKDFISTFKIEPVEEVSSQKYSNVIGFRGVVQGLGTTTLLSHVAYTLSSQGYSVVILDLNYQEPNQLFSDKKTLSINKKLNNIMENILEVINPTKYKGLSYVGANQMEPITNFMPLTIDNNYLKSRKEAYSKLISELRLKFDYVLIDLESDIRSFECIIPMKLCYKVITLTSYDNSCSIKFVKDTATLSGVVPADLFNNIVHVQQDVSLNSDYKSISKDINLICIIERSQAVYSNMIERKLRIGQDTGNVSDVEEQIYLKSITSVTDFIRKEVRGND